MQRLGPRVFLPAPTWCLSFPPVSLISWCLSGEIRPGQGLPPLQDLPDPTVQGARDSPKGDAGVTLGVKGAGVQGGGGLSLGSAVRTGLWPCCGAGMAARARVGNRGRGDGVGPGLGRGPVHSKRWLTAPSHCAAAAPRSGSPSAGLSFPQRVLIENYGGHHRGAPVYMNVDRVIPILSCRGRQRATGRRLLTPFPLEASVSPCALHTSTAFSSCAEGQPGLQSETPVSKN